MPRPKPKDYVQVKLRLHKDVVAKLKKAAKAARPEISFNAEAAMRLGKSFGEEEAFGGAEGRELVYLMAMAFTSAGQRVGDEKKAAKWFNDADAYRTAAFAALEALLVAGPAQDPSEMHLQIESLKGRIATRYANRGNSQ